MGLFLRDAADHMVEAEGRGQGSGTAGNKVTWRYDITAAVIGQLYTNEISPRSFAWGTYFFDLSR